MKKRNVGEIEELASSKNHRCGKKIKGQSVYHALRSVHVKHLFYKLHLLVEVV